MAADDWTRVDFYACRVRILAISDSPAQWDLISILQSLSFRRGSLILFPKLETLHWLCDLPRTALYIRLFLGGRLQALLMPPQTIIEEASTSKNVESSLTYLPLLSADIQELTLSFSPSSDFMPVLKRLALLSCLTLHSRHSLTTAVLHAICVLPNLRELALRCPLETAFRECSLGLDQPFFPSLKDLSLSGERTSLDAYIHFLETFPPPCLEEFQILECPGDLHALYRFLKTVSSVLSHKTLTHLSICGMSGVETENIDLNLLRPLLAFYRLEVLSLESRSHRFCLDDGSFQVIATAFPQLCYLRCATGYIAEDRVTAPTATIETVAILVRHCPRLSYIGIDFDASSLGPTFPRQRPGRGFSNSLVRILDVQRSRLKHPMVVAGYLSDLFPNLNMLSCNESIDRDLWKEVKVLLPLLSTVSAWRTSGAV